MKQYEHLLCRPSSLSSICDIYPLLAYWYINGFTSYLWLSLYELNSVYSNWFKNAAPIIISPIFFLIYFIFSLAHLFVNSMKIYIYIILRLQSLLTMSMAISLIQATIISQLDDRNTPHLFPCFSPLLISKQQPK